MSANEIHAPALCEFLPWDSTFFGFRIGRALPNRLSPAAMRDILCWCDSEAIRCLYFLADSSCGQTIALMEEKRFHLADIRVTLGRPVENTPPEPLPASVRPARPEDLPALRAIARASHHDTRFYHDPNFPRHLCDSLYETWIERSYQGWAEIVLVAEWDGRPAGYLSCHLASQETGRIGLMAVAQAARGAGLGRELVRSGLHWFGEHGCRRVLTVTQGRNCVAQRFYQRAGFVTQTVQLWYHLWLTP